MWMGEIWISAYLIKIAFDLLEADHIKLRGLHPSEKIFFMNCTQAVDVPRSYSHMPIATTLRGIRQSGTNLTSRF